MCPSKPHTSLLIIKLASIFIVLVQASFFLEILCNSRMEGLELAYVCYLFLTHIQPSEKRFEIFHTAVYNSVERILKRTWL